MIPYIFNFKIILFEKSFLSKKIQEMGERHSYKILKGVHWKKGISTSDLNKRIAEKKIKW